MRKFIIVMLVGMLSVPLMAQQHEPEQKKKHKEITEVVSDLDATQKRKIESIGKDMKERVAALRSQKEMLKDSIQVLMDTEGDQSALLFPMFSREAALQVAINREMYSGKRQIDEILTPEQRKTLKAACHKHNKQPKKRHK